MTGYHLLRSISKCFLHTICIEQKFENTPSLVLTGHYFKDCFVLLFLICQAKPIIANETRKLGLWALTSWLSEDYWNEFAYSEQGKHFAAILNTFWCSRNYDHKQNETTNKMLWFQGAFSLCSEYSFIVWIVIFCSLFLFSVTPGWSFCWLSGEYRLDFRR